MLSRTESIDGFHLKLSRTEKELYEEFLKTEEAEILAEMQQHESAKKSGGPVLATIGRTPRRTTRGIDRLKGSVAGLLQPAILRPPTFWRSQIPQPKRVPPDATPMQLVFLLGDDPSAPVDVELQNGLNRLSYF
jgi:hypothetical protein